MGFRRRRVWLGLMTSMGTTEAQKGGTHVVNFEEIELRKSRRCFIRRKWECASQSTFDVTRKRFY
jgi:hypothetical protein